MDRKMYNVARLVCAALFLLLGANVLASGGDSLTLPKTSLPASFFANKQIEGASSAKVTDLDKVTPVHFTDPYTPSHTMYVYAGTFKGSIDGNDAKFYCIDISHLVALYKDGQPNIYTDNGSTPGQITYILNYYYPFKSYPYTGSASTVEKEAAAIQAAIWSYSDGVDINTFQETEVKSRAQQIITDANAHYASFTPLNTFEFNLPAQFVSSNEDGSFSIHAVDEHGNGVPNLNVILSSSSGSLSNHSCTTSSSGYTPNIKCTKGNESNATITATTSFTIPQGTKYEHTSSPSGFQKLVLATPTIANRQCISSITWNPTQSNSCDLTGYTTFTQGGWGNPSNSTPGGIRDANFSIVFPSGMIVGGTKTAKFTSASAIKDFLPAGGTAGAFTTNYTNPSSTSAGVIGGQLVAATLNVEFNDAGKLGSNPVKIGNLVIASGPFSGKTVYQLLNYANIAIGGGTSSCTISDLNSALTAFNENYDNGTVNKGFLTCAVSVPGSVGSKLWNDANKNGVQDAGETGYPNTAVKLYDCNNNLKASSITDASGAVLFSNVAVGSYYVKFDLPSGYAFSPAHQGADDTKDSDVDTVTGQTTCFTLASGENSTKWDAGIYFNKVSIGDKVWNDANKNGIQDAGESGVSGVSVKLYTSADVFIATTTTDASGNYLFANQNPGTYYLQFTNPGGFVFSPKNVGSNSAVDSDVDAFGKTDNFTLVAGINDLTKDAGIYTPTKASIGNYVWNDLNKNGVQDTLEPGVSGVTVKLFNSSNVQVNSSVTTDANGLYLFSDVPVGDYYVNFILPANFTFTAKNQGGDLAKDSDPDQTTGNTINTTLSSAEIDLTWDAGLVSTLANVGGKAWKDNNENGKQDNSEPGIATVTVALYDCNNTLVATTTTNANGLYSFAGVTPASYYVQVTAPAGLSFTPKNQGTNTALDSDIDPLTGKSDCTPVLAGDIIKTWDAGFYATKASIGKLVWNDANQNGIKDAGEQGMPNITVSLYDCGTNLIATTVTDQNGQYGFSNLTSGDYSLFFALPAGYVFTSKDAGNDDAVDSDVDPVTAKTVCTTLSAGENDMTWSAGMYLPKAKLSAKVWDDVNRNGVRDADSVQHYFEQGISSVVVKLYTCAGSLVSTTTTDANGTYLFDYLTPGSYYIKVTPPTGYFFTGRNVGADTVIDSDIFPATGESECFVLTPGQTDNSRAAGMFQGKAKLGDFVWKDLNENGIQDNNESGIPSVFVRLYYSAGDSLAGSTTTDVNGYYSFDNIIPGTYYVKFTLPSTYTFSAKHQGSSSTLDSDVNPSTGKTDAIVLVAGTDITTVDAGMFIPNYDANLSLEKTSSVGTAGNGGQIMFTLKLKNNGPKTATGVTITDVLPAGMIFISANPSASYNSSTGLWTVGILASGSTATLEIAVQISVAALNNAVVDLGPAKEYNMFVLQDLIQPSSDTQGKLAVGRDAHLDGYSVGDQLENSFGAVDILVVGHDLTFLNGSVMNGNVVYGNSSNLPRTSVDVLNGTVRKASVIDFNAAASYLNNLSTQLAAQPVNGITTFFPYLEVKLVGTDPYLNVFSVSGDTLGLANNLNLNAPSGSVVLVNVTGHNVSWGMGYEVNGVSKNNVLFNFYQADSLYLNHIDVKGSILAPKASVNFPLGVQNGQMICKNYTGQGQMNLSPFVGNIPVTATVINSAEVMTADQHDPNSTPGNGVVTEDDYAQATVSVTNTNTSPTSPGWRPNGNVNNIPLSLAYEATGSLLAGTTNGGVYRQTASKSAVWTNLNMVNDAGSIWSVVPRENNRILVAAENGLYISNNDGANWSLSGLTKKDVRSVVVDKNNRLYASTWIDGVFKSDDNGATWTGINAGLPDLAGPHISTDTNNVIKHLINSLVATRHGDIFAATFGGGIYKLNTDGSAWSKVTIDYPFIWNLYESPSGLLYAATYGKGVYISVNGGSSWESMNTGLGNLYIYNVTVDAYSSVIATSLSGGVYKLPKGSNTWQMLGLSGSGVSALAAHPATDILVVATKDGSFVTTNGTTGITPEVTNNYEFALSQNYPNPFNPSTRINFSLPASQQVRLAVYNILGQEVRVLINNQMQAGTYTFDFKGEGLASGVYIYRLVAGNLSMTKKMILQK